MIDVKKLVTGFLILATAAICSGLVLSFVNNTGSTAVATSNPNQITITGDDSASDNTVAANAFISAQSLQDVVNEAAPALASSSMMVSSTDPDNLTDDLASEFVNGVVSANPDGPSGTDSDGNPIFTSPDVNSIANDIADTTTTANLDIPNWDIEAASIPVTVFPTTSSTVVFAYGTTVNNILNSHMNTDVQNILTNEADDASESDLATVEAQVQSEMQDVASVQTPSPAKAYQESLLAELVYEKNMLALNDLAQSDPVKATLIFQAEDQKFSTVEQNLVNQAQNLATVESLSMRQEPTTSQSTLLSFVDNTFGIPRANALLPVFDPASWSLIEANEAALIGHQLETLLKNTLLQILKNTLIAIIQREVLTWVQGSGAPRFITNWGTTLINAYQTTAINAINSLMSCGVYPSFIPQIKTTLGAYYKPGNNTCANQFAAALGSNSFQQFYNNFKNGGFIAFGASTLPSGNPYGGVFFNAQIVGNTANNASQAAAVKTNATGGFKGGEVCDDGSNPNSGEHTVCENPDGPDYTIQGSEQCGPGDTPVVYANNGTCSDGTQPVVTTPAAVTGFTLNSGIDATPKQIAAANSIVGVLNAVLSSLLTQLASTAVNAAGQLVNQGLTSINGSSITAGASASSTTPAAIPLACNPTTQTIPAAATVSTGAAGTGTSGTSTYPVTLSATGGTTDSAGDEPTYSWSSTDGTTSTGAIFSDILPNAGTFTITLNDSASDTPATCTVIVQ